MKLVTSQIENTPMEILLEDYYFDLNGNTVKIPVHYASDTASIPRVLSFLYKKEDKEKYWRHDFLYSKAFEKYGNKSITRKQADLKLFRDIRTWERYFIYIGVRISGWYSWKKDRNYVLYKEEIQKEILSSKKRLGKQHI